MDSLILSEETSLRPKQSIVPNIVAKRNKVDSENWSLNLQHDPNKYILWTDTSDTCLE